MPDRLSKKVKVTPPTAVSGDRYQFLDLEQAEPNLGVPSGSTDKVLVSTPSGTRYWQEQVPVETVVTLAEEQTLINKTLVSVKEIDFDPVAISADLNTISVTTGVLIDSFNATGYRSAEYLLQLVQGSNYAITKVLLIHDGLDVAISEFGYVGVGSPIAYDLSGSFSGANLQLLITCPTANVTPVSIKFSVTLFDA